MRFALSLAVLAAAAAVVPAADPPKRLLLVTHSLGFIHPSVGTAETVLKEIGPSNGFAVTCFRYTGDLNDPKFKKYQEEFRAKAGLPVDPEHCGRVNKETLKQFDAVLFFTTGNPLTKDELKDLIDWVRAGGAFAGTHCATDTLYGESAYGALVGAYFQGHPPGLQKINLKVEDPKHPAAAGFDVGMEYRDEIYIFRDAPYSRDKLHIILSADPATFNPGGKLARADKDYAISWCREEGKGKVFYTALGHDPKVWQDPRFQKHLLGGLRWATGQLPGDATPTGSK
jgi:type 1 glutamine amidotransferase